MKKTIFRKVFLYNIIIVFLSVILTTILLFTQLGQYFKASMYKTLESRAKLVAGMSEVVTEMTGSMKNVYRMRELMKEFGIDEGQGFVVLDTEGNIMVDAGFKENQLNKAEFDVLNILQPLDGYTVRAESRLGGLFRDKFLYVATPIEVNGTVVGAVVVCSTVPYIQNMQYDVMKLFLITVLFVIAIVLIVSALLSRRITRPIKEMTTVVKKISMGDFSQKVSRDADGELAILAASFNQMTTALGEMDEVQSSFISDVSHELRTPMTIISGFVEGVLDGTIPENEHKKYLEIVLSEIKRLSNLVNDLLEMSRLKSGNVEYKMVPFDITENMRKAIVSFEQRINEKNADVEVDFEDDSMYVLGNSDSIYRVITNLMDNAVKFVPENGSIVIRIATENGKTKVSVQNSGAGLSPKELGRIWDRFYQTDKSRSSQNRGAGLGLYIVKNIMQAHNNNIYAESEEGSWTRFTFELDSVKNK